MWCSWHNHFCESFRMASVVKRSYLKGLSNYTITILAGRLCKVLFRSYKSEYMFISALKFMMIFIRATGRPQEHAIDSYLWLRVTANLRSHRTEPISTCLNFFLPYQLQWYMPWITSGFNRPEIIAKGATEDLGWTVCFTVAIVERLQKYVCVSIFFWEKTLSESSGSPSLADSPTPPLEVSWSSCRQYGFFPILPTMCLPLHNPMNCFGSDISACLAFCS